MLKKYVDLVVKSRLILTSTGRTMLKLPVWAAALLVLLLVLLMSPGASVLIAIIAVVTGHRFRIEKDYIMRT